MAEVFILLFITIVLVVTALFWSYSHTEWFEKRFPALFSPSMAEHLEGIATLRPLNHLGMHFLAALGGIGVLQDIAQYSFSSWFRYAFAIILATFLLYMARRSAFQRASESESAGRGAAAR